MAHAVRVKTARIVRRIVLAAAGIASVAQTLKTAAIVPAIAARVVAMVNATTTKRVRVA